MPNQIRTHVFHKLGAAPFKCIGVYQDIGPHRYPGPGGVTIEVGAPGQAMGVCAHCGTGIADCYRIRSADGKEFVVGSTCVEKTGDAGLKKSMKTSPEVRALARTKREALANRKWEELKTLMAQNEERLKAMPRLRYDGTNEPMLEYLQRVIPMCGAAGRARYLAHIKKLLAA